MDYYRLSEQKVLKGLTLNDLIRMASEGSIAESDMVRLDGQDYFLPIMEIEELKQAIQSPAPAATGIEPTPVDPPRKPTPVREITPPPVPSNTVSSATEASNDQAKIDFEASAPIGKIGKRKTHEDDSGVDLTPMIDVVFLLLIFFIVTHTINAKPPIDLPEATFGKGLTPDGMQMILIDQEGEYYLGNKEEENLVSGLDTLIAEVLKNAQNTPDALEVVIDAHPGTDHGNVRMVAEEISQLENIGKISLGVVHKKE